MDKYESDGGLEFWANGLAPLTSESKYESCFCVGPQNGDPMCPCSMRKLREAELKTNVMIKLPLNKDYIEQLEKLLGKSDIGTHASKEEIELWQKCHGKWCHG